MVGHLYLNTNLTSQLPSHLWTFTLKAMYLKLKFRLSFFSQLDHVYILLETVRKNFNTKKRRRWGGREGNKKDSSQWLWEGFHLGEMQYKTISINYPQPLKSSAWEWDPSIVLTFGAPSLALLSWEQQMDIGWQLPIAYKSISLDCQTLLASKENILTLFTISSVDWVGGPHLQNPVAL